MMGTYPLSPTWSTAWDDNYTSNTETTTSTVVNYSWEPAADCYVIDDPPDDKVEEARECVPLPRAPKRLGKPRRMPKEIWKPG